MKNISLIFFAIFTIGWLACTDRSKPQEVVDKQLHEARDNAQDKNAADSLSDAVNQQYNDSAGMKIGGNELDSKRN